VVEFVASPANREVIDRLRRAEVALVEPGARGPGPGSGAGVAGAGAGAGDAAGEAGGLPQTLEGRSVVVTGTIEGYTREEAEEAILARGGKSPGSVSARTWAVVLGTEPGTAKLKKAEELGIPVVEGDRFQALLDSGEIPGA
jgi:DNA ligase (NAD+)